MKNAEGRIKPKEGAKSEEFTHFERTLRNLMAVPKCEIDKERAKYDREREKEGKRKRPAK
jgi:hypothetical protein